MPARALTNSVISEVGENKRPFVRGAFQGEPGDLGGVQEGRIGAGGGTEHPARAQNRVPGHQRLFLRAEGQRSRVLFLL